MDACFLAIVGLLLGFSHTLITNLPADAAYFFGITALARMTTFLLVAFVAALLRKETWRKSFFASYFTIVLAFAAFFISFPFLSLRITRFLVRGPLIWGSYFPQPALQPFTILSSLTAFGQWAFMSAVVCAIAATVVWLIQRTASMINTCVIFMLTYLCFLWLIYYERIRFIVFSWRRTTMEGFDFGPRYFARLIVEVIYLVIFVTIVFYIGLRSATKSKNAPS